MKDVGQEGLVMDVTASANRTSNDWEWLKNVGLDEFLVDGRQAP